MSDVIDKLRDDSRYYGKFGRQFLSNSDIKVLLEDPSKYGVPTPDNPAFAGVASSISSSLSRRRQLT